MDKKQRKKLISCLSKIFLKYRDPDEGYFKILRILNRLKYRGIYIDIIEVQETAYGQEVE